MPAAASHAHSVPRTPRAFGPFALRELLGRSQRTMLWLAHDTASGQDRLLTLPRAAPPDLAGIARWVSEARRAARLAHPHLAPVIDVAVHEQWPYVVCDRALGRTLAEHLAEHPSPSHAEVADWWRQALEGLAFAHEAGIAHHDLQLHQLLIDERGQLRVMALAAGVASPADAHGTSSLQVQRQAAERDVLALGVMLHQLIAGEAPFGESDVGRAIERLAPSGRDTLRLPWTTPQPVSETLRTIVNRATHAQPRQRYLSARTLLHALESWRAADAKDTGGPVAQLIDRVIAIGHLPAMPGAAATVSRLSRMERQRTDELAEQVLLDLALSFELLRQVNSMQVQGAQAAGSGPVLTVRRAIAMLGLDGVRRAAQALRDWPGPLGPSAAAALRGLIERVRLAGHVARRLRPAGYDAEVVFLVTVLQNLGRLMLQFHFAEDAEQVARLMQPLPVDGGKPQPGMSETAAALSVLGVEVEALGLALARHWGLGEEAMHMLRRLPADRPVRAPDGDADLLRATASCANEVIDASLLPPGPASVAAFEAIAKRYARPLAITLRDLHDALRDARHARDHGAPLLTDEVPDAPRAAAHAP